VCAQLLAQCERKIDLPRACVRLRRPDRHDAGGEVRVAPVERARLAVSEPGAGERRKKWAQRSGGIE